ncbi:unnamed protein product [Strongylus vulgaris]|uniref:Uncharacterized protein n=1 Tax=Strongylus vulgaris TaxID=40348 RepID=A0A3P7KAE4_STRVU|nr:unnamed protein product [Strongylus vulgaris]
MSSRKQEQARQRRREARISYTAEMGEVSSAKVPEKEERAQIVEDFSPHVTFYSVRRSYPDSYYPRANSLPPPSARMQRKRHRSEHRTPNQIDVPRLKLHRK